MFSELLSVRFRAAEKALREGRIDEAYRLASAPDLRAHKRGMAVLASLSEKFLERARDHYRSDKFTEALMDLDRADAGGVLKDEIDELRGYVRTVAAEQQRGENSRRERIDAAVRRIEGGSLAAGRDMLERAATNDQGAAVLRRKAAERADDTARIVEQAERLLSTNQLAAAAERVRRAKSIDAHNDAVARVEARLCSSVLENARTALIEGSPGRAASELACLGELGKALPSLHELSEMLAIANEAGGRLKAHEYAEARRQAMSLARKLPNATWIESAIEQLRQLDELHTAACAGPFGDRVSVTQTKTPSPRRVHKSPASLDDTVALPHGRLVDETSLPERLLLLIDGGGSFLLLRGGRASLGRVASDAPADIPIYSDVAERQANIARVDDDYFLFSAKNVEVAGKKTQHELLRDGDRVVLGRKAKFTFRLPSRKSSTAVLDLSDTTKAPNDVRRVVLFNHHATVGNSPNAHVFCRHAGPTLVLFERSGSLWIRAKSDGHVDTEAQPLVIGEPVEIGGISLVLEPWKLTTPGGRKA